MADYIYDALGYRVVKHGNSETIHYVFEGTETIFEKNVTTDEIKSYVYALGKHLARVDGVIGDSTANAYYYHNDHLGSVRAVSDSSGEVVWSADYLAFGKQVECEGDGFSEWHGFTGKAYDKDTGLYYYNARWYDASTGRFISVDPIGDGVNWYIYGNNNPIIIFDPTGLEGEYFQLPYTQKQNYFDVFSGPWWLTPLEAVANVGVFAGNSFIDITNTLTGGVNLLLYAGQNPNWNYELMDAIAYGPGKLSDETIYYFQNTSSEQIISDLKESFTDPATYERALANFVIMWVGYKSSVIQNQGNGLEGKQFDFDEVDDFVKESYDDLSAEGKQIVGEYVDNAASSKEFTSWLNKGTNKYGNYIGSNPVTYTDEYTGITGNLFKRGNQWKGVYDLTPLQETFNLTKSQARCIEEAIIINNPSFKNVIHSISQQRPFYSEAVNWGTNWLKNNGFSSLLGGS